ncbi:MAG: hypothetical protein ACO3A7_12920 [Burkholderiaceae bacterium]
MGISKRGDAHLRCLSMHGARAIIAQRRYSDWAAGLIARQPVSVIIAAIANKLARTILVVLATGKRYGKAAFTAAI